ncbi:MAG: BolA/IbaG family iron-sulfur metabolism protein [gamma proteobacterium symbiont of Bathyaustriella thionipta]|nr:BolA/IbaG family iron-sulfur metabolism protein [gamma proteobacterium symbiont of Bathyaustriella thionipta]
MEKEIISKRIKGLYPDAEVEANGSDCSFEVLIVSAAFESIRPLKRQQSILGLFSEELKSGKLHALGVKAKTPEELKSMPSNLLQIS